MNRQPTHLCPKHSFRRTRTQQPQCVDCHYERRLAGYERRICALEEQLEQLEIELDALEITEITDTAKIET